MILLSRQLICERLHLSRSASYRIIGCARLDRISSDDVIEMLNGCRCGCQSVVSDVPSDIMDAAGLSVALQNLNIEMSTNDIIRYSNRKKNTAPHWRINKHCRRYRLSSFVKWLTDNIQVRRLRCRVRMSV